MKGNTYSKKRRFPQETMINSVDISCAHAAHVVALALPNIKVDLKENSHLSRKINKVFPRGFLKAKNEGKIRL